jgi:hypothetical protein
VAEGGSPYQIALDVAALAQDFGFGKTHSCVLLAGRPSLIHCSFMGSEVMTLSKQPGFHSEEFCKCCSQHTEHLRLPPAGFNCLPKFLKELRFQSFVSEAVEPKTFWELLRPDGLLSSFGFIDQHVERHRVVCEKLAGLTQGDVAKVRVCVKTTTPHTMPHATMYVQTACIIWNASGC